MDVSRIQRSPRRVDVKRRNIKSEEDLADTRRAEKELSRDQIQARLKEWEVTARNEANFHGDRLKTVYANERCLSWGTLHPMVSSEEAIHDRLAQAIGIDKVSHLESRPLYVVGKWLLEGEMVVSALVVHPAIVTSTVAINNDADEVDALLHCYSNMRVVSEPSSGKSSHVIRTSAGRTRLMGRFSLRGSEKCSLSLGRQLELPTYVNMSSSCLIFVVSLRGNSWVCNISVETCRLLSAETQGSVHSNLHNERLIIYAWRRSDVRDSHIKLGSNGSLTFVGAPNDMPTLLETLCDMINRIGDNSASCRGLLGTLKVASTLGETLIPR